MGPGILPETTVGKHKPPCHLQMPTKAHSCKKETICEHGPEAPLCPVGQSSFKMDCFKVEKWSDESKFEILVGNHGCCVLQAKEEGDPPACHQCKNPSKMTTNSSADENLYQARMGPNSNPKTPETNNFDAQMSLNCFEKRRRCYAMVNMHPSQLF